MANWATIVLVNMARLPSLRRGLIEGTCTFVHRTNKRGNSLILIPARQIPQDEWGGYPGEKDDEIPCRRMRSSSYVKAMGEVDDDSGDSESPKTSPQKCVRPDALVLKSAMQRPHFDTHR